MAYSYYDYLIQYYHDYYDYYYEYYYWPYYYNISHNDTTWCYNLTHHNITYNESHYYNETPSTFNETDNTAYWTTLEPTQFYNTTSFNCTFPEHGFPYQKWWYNGMEHIGPTVTILAFVLAVLAIVIDGFFFKELRASLNSKKRSPSKLTIAISVTCLLSHTMYILADVFAYWYWYYDYIWDIVFYVDMVWEFFWMVSKVTMYSLFAYRYYMIQKATLNRAEVKQQTRATFGLIAMAILTQIALEITYGVYYYDYLTVGWDDPDFARKQRMYLNAAWAVMAIDGVLVIFLGYLIVRTILQLVISINDPTRAGLASRSRETTQSGGQSVNSGHSNSPVTAPPTGAPTGAPELGLAGSGSTENAEQSKARHRVWSVSLRSKSGITSEERRRNRSSRQMNLIEVTTRIALICCISLWSSLIVQFMWIIMEETENWGLLFFSYFWGIDAVVNMLCVYFTMAFAKKHYEFVCGTVCKCHGCCLWCIMKLVSSKTDMKQETELAAAESDHSGKADPRKFRAETIDVTDVSPIPPDSPSMGSGDKKFEYK